MIWLVNFVYPSWLYEQFFKFRLDFSYNNDSMKNWLYEQFSVNNWLYEQFFKFRLVASYNNDMASIFCIPLLTLSHKESNL